MKTKIYFFNEETTASKDRKRITETGNDLDKQFLDEKKRQAAEPLYLMRYE